MRNSLLISETFPSEARSITIDVPEILHTCHQEMIDQVNANDLIRWANGNRIAAARASGLWTAAHILRDSASIMGIELPVPIRLNSRPHLEVLQEDCPTR